MPWWTKMEINLKKVFHSWGLEAFLLPPCKACTRSFNTSGNMTTPLVCRWTFIAQNQQVVYIWQYDYPASAQFSNTTCTPSFRWLLALLLAVPLQRCPTSCLELRCSCKWLNSRWPMRHIYQGCTSATASWKLSTNHPLFREYTWSTSSRNPVAFLVLKEMSSQKIYLQDYITVCPNSVYI